MHRGNLVARFLSQRSARLGAAIALPIVGAVVLAPFVSPTGPLVQHRGLELAQPSALFLLGSDEFGRDVFTRLLYGGRVTIVVGIVSTTVGAVIGLSIGIVAGYLGGAIDSISMRVVDVILAFPAVVIGFGIVALEGPGPVGLIAAIALSNIPVFARLTRAGAMTLRHREFIEAAVVSGVAPLPIIRMHIVPNLVPVMLVQFGISVASAMLLEAGLSYLGVGVQPPDPSWGGMLSNAQTYMRLTPVYAIAPGVALMLTVLSVNFMVDGLRDAVDPHRETARRSAQV